MRNSRVQRGIGAAALVGLMAVGACAGDKASAAVSLNRFDIATASCNANNEIELNVDAWTVRITANAVVPWLQRTGNATVSIIPKNPGSWPFIEPGEFTLIRGQAVNRTVKASPGNSGTRYRFKIKVVCGAAPNQQTAIIDPDIFVD